MVKLKKQFLYSFFFKNKQLRHETVQECEGDDLLYSHSENVRREKYDTGVLLNGNNKFCENV